MGSPPSNKLVLQGKEDEVETFPHFVGYFEFEMLLSGGYRHEQEGQAAYMMVFLSLRMPSKFERTVFITLGICLVYQSFEYVDLERPPMVVLSTEAMMILSTCNVKSQPK